MGSEGRDDNGIWNWREEGPGFIVTENLVGFCPEAKSKAELVQDEFRYLSEEFPKQSDEGAAWLLLAHCSKRDNKEVCVRSWLSSSLSSKDRKIASVTLTRRQDTCLLPFMGMEYVYVTRGFHHDQGSPLLEME